MLPNGDQHIVVMVPCSDSESEDCRSAKADTVISHEQSTLDLDAKPSRLSPESLFAIRARMTHRFRYVSRLSQSELQSQAGCTRPRSRSTGIFNVFKEFWP